MSTTTLILSILIPIVIVPIISGIVWIIRGLYENHLKVSNDMFERKKEFFLENTQLQISEFYWPMYIYLIKYKSYYEMYEKLKSGNVAITSLSNNDINDQDIKSSITLMDNVIYNNILFDTDSDNSDESFGFKKSYLTSNLNNDKYEKIVEEFKIIISEYEKIMIICLLKIQKIYTKKIRYIEPDFEFFYSLVNLDKFITHTYALNKHLSKTPESLILNSEIEYDKFPVSIYQMVEDRLKILQIELKKIINNKKNIILDSNTKENKETYTFSSMFNTLRKKNNRNKNDHVSIPMDMISFAQPITEKDINIHENLV